MCQVVLLTRIELVIALYQSAGMPFTYRRELAGLERIELPPSVSKTDMISISLKALMVPLDRFELSQISF